MISLADFLDREREALVQAFANRIKGIAPVGLSRSQLIDHVPQLLGKLAHAIRTETRTIQLLVTTNASAEEHGRQRVSVGYDLDGVVREYGILHDCILERVEATEFKPQTRELRRLADCLAAATADSVDQYVRYQHTAEDSGRRYLLEMFQQAPGFVCFLRGRNLVFELANASYFQLVGHRDIIGRPLREALPEVAGQGFFELLDSVYVTGEPFVGRGMRAMIQREPGAPLSEAFIDLIYQPIRGANGEIVGILTQGHDVTELRRQQAQRELAEASMRASEERYRTLFDSIDEGFCLLEMLFDDTGQPVDYRFLQTNASFDEQTGLANAAGKTARELVPDLDRSWFERYGAVATTGQSIRFENHAPAMGRWFEVYATRVGPAELHQVGLVFKDVTARKRGEEERERLLALESAARQAAEETTRLRDEFLATVSHELRTPLAAILGWVQMLRAESLPVEKRERALETIERNARAQAQLVEDLLDVSSILAGKLRLQVEAVELHAIVEAALETVRPAANAKDILLQATLGSGGAVMGDPHRLQQVVWNLLSNAVKFTPKGGRVQVILDHRDSSVDITVADTGQGIAKEFQEHVFERFRQADGRTTRTQGGLGLGLSIVRQLVEMHGGTVSVSSDGKGHGASFTVTLPVAVARRREVSEPAPMQVLLAKGVQCPPELHGLHVVVVDDEDDTRELIETLLANCGARVRAASSAAEALRLIQAQRPDVLVSDIGMPEEDGYSLIQRVRQLPIDAGGNVPAVALTAYARTQDRTRALLSGFSNHVAKPVEPLELLAVIASLSGRATRHHP